MAILQSRRRFATGAAIAGLAGLGVFDAIGSGGSGRSLAAESPPEISSIRIERDPAVCIASVFVVEELLHAEGFAEIRFFDLEKHSPIQQLALDETDWTLDFAPEAIVDLDGGAPATIVAGVHVGCFELFAHDHVRSVGDLKGRTVGVPPGFATPRHLVSIMASYVGINANDDIHWVSDPSVKPMDLFIRGKIDAFLASPPRSQELHARGIGHTLVNSSTDRPWSQYFCCMLAGRTEFIRKYPIATKRVLRAMLKATDLCASKPETVAQFLVDGGVTRFDYALQALKELPYVWRDYDPEDTVRWYALRLNEGGFTKTAPQDVIANHTDWRFLNELKRELKI